MNGGLSIPSTTDVRFVPFVTFSTTSVKRSAPSLSYKIPAITTQQDRKICHTAVNRVNTQQDSLRHLWLILGQILCDVLYDVIITYSSCDILLMWHCTASTVHTELSCKMERFLVLCILFLAAVCAEEGLNYRDDVDFMQWSSMHLEAGSDLAKIYPVWKKNAEFVRAQNSLKLSYTVAMNKFGHLVKLCKNIFCFALICAASHSPFLQRT